MLIRRSLANGERGAYLVVSAASPALIETVTPQISTVAA